MSEIAQAGQGLFASLKGLVKTLVGIGQNRLELLLLELQEERWRLFEALLLAGFALILGLMTLMVITIWIVIVCVLGHTLWGVLVLLGLYVAGTLICLWQLRSLLKNWAPFSATLSELKKDKECLEDEK